MVVLALSGACAAGAQAGNSFSSLLPDTLLPFQILMVNVPDSVTATRNWPPAVELRRGTTRMLLNRYGSVGFYYSLEGHVPLNAAIGSYDAYSGSGTLLERNVTYVADARKLVPRLDVVRARGIRGLSYSLTGNAMGLPFGPLPKSDSAAYVPSFRYFALENGKDTLRPATGISPVSYPYHFYMSLNVPLTAAFGPYRLVVEREDGIRTVADSAFTVEPTPAPANVTVSPDSLEAGSSATLGITGLNLEYATYQASFPFLDRQRLQQVFLRRGAEILPATGLALGSSRYPGNAGPLQASFDVPPGFPVGPCDLGFAIATRGDTAYVPGIVRVFAPLPPEIIAFSPQSAPKQAFTASLETRNVRGDWTQAGLFLRRGNSAIKGTFSAYGTTVEVAFAPDSSADTGWYDFDADFPGRPALTYPHAVRIVGTTGLFRPAIGAASAPQARWSGNRLDLELRAPAVAELRTLPGRLLLRAGALPPGRHAFATPPSAQGEAVLLWRLRSAAGETWLRIAREP